MLNGENRELLIGLILEDIGSDFSKELVKSTVNSVSADKNVRLFILPGKYNNEYSDERIRACKTIQNTVFELSRICSFDGFIIHLGGNKEEFSRHAQLSETDPVPRVFIGIDSEDLVTVNYDNSSGIGEAVNYLVNICGITKICMLGGREDNKDARLRKDVFRNCLAENGIALDESAFINTDMTDNCTDEAAALLDRNPDAEAVFCVNDAAAKALYSVMEDRKLVPGSDIMVFGFDNTFMSSELIPPLSSVGASDVTLGQKAVELIISMTGGEKVSSALVPTRLFGRDSLPYEMYDYTTLEMENIESAFVYRMFDDCFYRYRNEFRSREMIDLKRLFYEIISQILVAMKMRYMSREQFDELCGLIDIFFDNGAVLYTDASKLIKSVKRFQDASNALQRSASMNLMINRLFLRMKDRALLSLSAELSQEKKRRKHSINRLADFTAESMVFGDMQQSRITSIIKSIPDLGLRNAAFYMFAEKVVCTADAPAKLPEKILLKCVVRGGKTHIIPEQRQLCSVSEMFTRCEIPKNTAGIVTFPVFFGSIIYGFLLCGCEGDICDKGEYIALQLGMALSSEEN